jgi:hypothetical protein
MSDQSVATSGQGQPQETPRAYFTVGAVKFSLMSLTTAGLYELYWFYRNWQIIGPRCRNRISPFWRAFFAPFWTFSMGSRFKQEARDRNIRLTLPVTVLGVSYLLVNMTWRLPGAYWCISLLTFLPILPFEFAARRLNGGGLLAAPTFRRFSGWNIAWLPIGFLLLGLAAFGQVSRSPTGKLMVTAWVVNRETPKMIDSVTRFDGVESGPGLSFQYDFSLLNESASDTDATIVHARFQGEVRRKLVSVVCNSQDTKVFRDLGAVVRYHFVDKRGMPLDTVVIPTLECQPAL